MGEDEWKCVKCDKVAHCSDDYKERNHMDCAHYLEVVSR